MISRRRFDRSHDELKRLIDRIEVNLMIRDPGSAQAAEAYEGLRKGVAVAARERTQHLFQLAEFSDALERGATIETLKDRVAEWSAQAGLVRVDISDNPDLFDIAGGTGPHLEVEQPAWIDPTANVIVKRGVASRREIEGTPSKEAAQGREDIRPNGDPFDVPDMEATT